MNINKGRYPNMASHRSKGIRIDSQFQVHGVPNREFMKNLSILQKPPIKSKNSESNKILEFKININLYIPLQTMFPTRGYL
jgi:hypothetical protein